MDCVENGMKEKLIGCELKRNVKRIPPETEILCYLGMASLVPRLAPTRSIRSSRDHGILLQENKHQIDQTEGTTLGKIHVNIKTHNWE